MEPISRPRIRFFFIVGRYPEDLKLRKNRDFCERNFRPVFWLLAVLVVATAAWAFFGVRQAAGSGPTPAGDGRGLAGAGATVAPGMPPVDALTAATQRGGLNLIGRRGWLAPDAPRSHLQNAFNVVSFRIQPAVVNINATREQAGPPGLPPGEGIRFVAPFRQGVARRRPSSFESVGAGVIIDARGFILTNYHVVSRARKLLVSIFGEIGRDFPATVVAADPRNDLALLRVPTAPPLPAAKLGDSDLVQVGDCVLAFGSPFGLDQTVTQGIISSKRKSLVVEGVSYGNMLQTDAPINRGSSGGPLVNTRAEVIGINTAIYGPGGVFSGTGFAIPSNRAKAFLAKVKDVLQK